MDFPGLGSSGLDTIIDQCWRAHYESVESLAKEMAGSGSAMNLPYTIPLGDQYIAERRARCKCLVDDGLLQEAGGE